MKKKKKKPKEKNWVPNQEKNCFACNFTVSMNVIPSKCKEILYLYSKFALLWRNPFIAILLFLLFSTNAHFRRNSQHYYYKPGYRLEQTAGLRRRKVRVGGRDVYR